MKKVKILVASISISFMLATESKSAIIFQTGFTGGLPGGWVIVDGDSDGRTWTSTNPGSRANPNWAETFMIVDSDFAGSIDMDEALVTHSIDCSTYAGVTLRFKHYFRQYESEICDVDVRVDGVWQNVARYQYSSASGLVELDLSHIAGGQRDVQIRWHYYNANYEYYWGIDDIEICGEPVTAPVIWTKYSENPVLKPGPPDSWDIEELGDPEVLKDGSVYRMWYWGNDGMIDRIGYATSTDGINWTKYGPVLEPGAPGTWDSSGIGELSVIKDGNTYKMWYSGDDGVNGRIGYTVSNDGINWQKCASNPVLDIGPSGSSDDESVTEPSVIKDGNTYKMWFTANDSGPVGYAISDDGINWTKYPRNPVLDFGAPGSWDDAEVDNPFVIKNCDVYEMWYGGRHNVSAIGYATSREGIWWTKYGGNPVLRPGLPGSWDDKVDCPSVIKDGSLYKMWYDASSQGIGYAWAGEEQQPEPESEEPFYKTQIVPFTDPYRDFVFIKNAEGINSWAGEDYGAVRIVAINNNLDEVGLGVPEGGFYGNQGIVLVYDVTDESGNGSLCALSTAFHEGVSSPLSYWRAEGGPGAAGLPTDLSTAAVHVDIDFAVLGNPSILTLRNALGFWIGEEDGDGFETPGIFNLTKGWHTYTYELNQLANYPEGEGFVFGDSPVSLLGISLEDPSVPQGLHTLVYFVDNVRITDEKGQTIFFEDFEAECAPLDADLNNDCVVDFLDFEVMASSWLEGTQ